VGLFFLLLLEFLRFSLRFYLAVTVPFPPFKLSVQCICLLVFPFLG